MIVAVVVTRWIGAGTEANPYRLEVRDHYPASPCSDPIGHQRVPYTPNVALAVLWLRPADAVALAADARYDGLILWHWREGQRGSWERDEVIDAVALARLNAGLVRLGLTVGVAGAVSAALEGKTRAQAGEMVRAWALQRASSR